MRKLVLKHLLKGGSKTLDAISQWHKIFVGSSRRHGRGRVG
jgi:hypothetical protein